MSHIFRHDKTGNCAGRSQHNDNGNQLVLCKTASDGKGQKKSFITDQFHKGTGDGCFEPGKSFPKMKRSTHGHETKRSSSFGKIAYGRVQDLRKGKAKKRPECTGNNTENDGIGDNAF